jgi:hypothetical protein
MENLSLRLSIDKSIQGDVGPETSARGETPAMWPFVSGMKAKSATCAVGAIRAHDDAQPRSASRAVVAVKIA